MEDLVMIRKKFFIYFFIDFFVIFKKIWIIDLILKIYVL